MLYICLYNNKANIKRLRASEVADQKKFTQGLLLQLVIPLVLVLPQTIIEALFLIDTRIRAPRIFWVLINGATCLYFSINPIISIIFVSQFRFACRRLFNQIFAKITPQQQISIAHSNTFFVNSEH
ncbi:hypothetical protein Tcan_09980 [Toxocara canis]|uniref:G_PROTEIN_RECEP_F1_2 domain-containing protein n=1 Tax=Toxocara canis TaxID=6265 RepID=A0A0B2UQ39_TOXCA|nr:hypothetical protein Tcan_09980 [Toxocara canis]